MTDDPWKKRKEIMGAIQQEFTGSRQLFCTTREDVHGNHRLYVENSNRQEIEITDFDDWREQIRRSGILNSSSD